MQFKVLMTAALLGVANVAAEEVWQLNITDPSQIESIIAAELSKRQSATWCAIFWTGFQDCSGSLTDGWCGSTDAGCIALQTGGAKSVAWYPSSSGKTIQFTTNNHCALCCGGRGGPGSNGCVGAPANVAQSGIYSFSVFT